MLQMQTISLNGEWTVARDGTEQQVAAAVPGDVYADLLAAHEIVDPFYRDHEESLQWIGEADWRYRRTFAVEPELLERDCLVLKCHGLDTLAAVSLNGRELGKTDNMFRVWEWDVKPFLKSGQNAIEVLFASTISHIEARQGERPLPWRRAARSKEKAACHGWVRKEQCNYGWDWGIKAVTCGIWRDIELLAFDRARLVEVAISQDHTAAGRVGLRLGVAAQVVDPKAALRVETAVRLRGEPVAAAKFSLAAGQGEGELTVDRAELWWPNGLGRQPLYELEVRLVDENSGATLDRRVKRIGLRTLRLQRQADQWGESFQFAVNGVPFFAKGANWIPADGILARMTPSRYRRLVADAAAVNMNMLRVWGGGIYEDAAFYDACDELGICVWQDFMFACSAYPTFDAGFMATVEAEARDQVGRLRHHPCLALWCGNNELEQGWVGDRGWENGQMPWDEYGRLFDRLLPDVVRELNPETDYWPSSPHSPCGDRADHRNPACGDAHLWGVWHGRKPFEWYRDCEHRFNSEFGFQSFPEPRTVREYTAPEDRNITSWIMEHHQRSGIGNSTIMHYMLDWFRLPVGFEHTLWLSQILQGMAIKYACEHWRRSRPRGMGTLYWQLNDTWPVASWSSIDYYGRWKALHYMARHFFAPLLLSGLEDAEKGTVELHATNDGPEARSGTILWRATSAAGRELAGGDINAVAAGQADTPVATLDLRELLAEPGCRDLLLWLEWREGGAAVARNLTLFARPKHLQLSMQPEIRVRAEALSENVFRISLAADRPALWVWLELDGAEAKWSDNFIHLPGAGTEFQVEVELERPVSREWLDENLRVRSLVDTFREQ